MRRTTEQRQGPPTITSFGMMWVAENFLPRTSPVTSEFSAVGTLTGWRLVGAYV